MTITKRQQQVLEAVQDLTRQNGLPPTVRDICRELGLASPGSLTKHLHALEKQGQLDRVPGRSRAWRPVHREGGPVIPLLGRIAAGAPLLAEENREAELPVDPALFGCRSPFALEVRGDSMIDAQIRDGDLAIIRPQEEVENGRIAAVLVEGVEPEATLKVVRHHGNRIELHPANEAYEPLVFQGEEMARVRILGRMVGLIRSRADKGKLFPCVGRGFFR